MKAVLLALGCASGMLAAQVRQADVVVYGDASGGVTAAVQAARMGKSVILISQYGHLGGMTSSGLGYTDIGNTSILGGLSREFYHLVYKHYEDPQAWNWQKRSEYGNKGQGAPALDPKRELASTFEPKVAEKVFNEMIVRAGVRVIKGRIDLHRGVIKEGKRIVAIDLEDGRTVDGKMFIDASYEGDLLAQAGVSFRMGREANSEFKETGNGNTGGLPTNQLPKGINPYVEKGNSESGLLPSVNATIGGKKGDADHRFQAYCYRMVLTDHSENRVQVTKPKNYQETDYELLFRTIEAGQNRFFKLSAMPNRKTDSNNSGGLSTDYIGGNYGKTWNWATLNHDEREYVAELHRDWQLGLIWTLQNHPRVPPALRDKYAPWGLAADEFKDNKNWPYNLYVREARRMASDFVMTEAHCRNQLPIKDSVGMGAYTLDSHNVQRYVHKGMVQNEGDIQSRISKTGPYAISYRAIVPKEEECENLLVPWALSSTHIAFGSIRMEPVFMVLGQSSATAACIAIDDKVSVQKVDYQKLRKRLLADGQALEVAPPTPQTGLDLKKLKGIVVDDAQAKRSGNWHPGSNISDSIGEGYYHDNATGNGQCSAEFTAKLPKAGRYEVRVAYAAYQNRATNVPVTIIHAAGEKTVTINQRRNPPIQGHFVSVGEFDFPKKATVSITNKNTDGHVIIDGVQWLPR